MSSVKTVADGGLSQSYKGEIIFIHSKQVLGHSYMVKGHNAHIPERKRKCGGNELNYSGQRQSVFRKD